MSTAPDNEIDYLDLSDEEVARMGAPAPVAAVPAQPDPADAAPPVVEESVPAVPAADDEEEQGDQADDAGQAPAIPTQTPAADALIDPKDGAAGADAGEEGKKEAAKTTDETTTPASTDFAAQLAAALQGGIKANGKTIQIRSADEALKLIQMGAGYTPAMQKLAPVRRIAKMLENNGLLDESKITYLIDLHQKNPAAIQKLLADSEFDPLSVDKAKADGYVPGDHQVTDTEVQFQTALDDLIQTPEGTTFLQEIQGQWDTASKRALFQEPSLVNTLNLQRSNGIYQQITGEIDRLTVLGQIPEGTPFLQAYRAVGDMLNDAGKLVAQGTAPDSAKAPAAPAAPSQASNAGTPPVDRAPPAAAKAAAPVRNIATKPTPTTPNYLDMSDAEFEKQSRGR